jgi:Uncharacterized phage-encoded protein
MENGGRFIMNINELEQVEYNGDLILTSEQLADFYGTETRRIADNFKRNEDRFVEGKHYYLLKGASLKEFKSQYSLKGLPINKFASSLYLWTERGASRHAKILDSDQAWNVFDTLEDTYFTVKEIVKQDSYLIKDPIKRAEAWIVETKEKIALQHKNEEQQKIIEHDKPIVEYTTKVVVNKKDKNEMQDIAHNLTNAGYNMGKNKIMAWMRMNHYLLKGNKWNQPSQDMKNRGYLASQDKTRVDSYGETHIYKKTYVTSKGVVWFTRNIMKWLDEGHTVKELDNE